MDVLFAAFMSWAFFGIAAALLCVEGGFFDFQRSKTSIFITVVNLILGGPITFAVMAYLYANS